MFGNLVKHKKKFLQGETPSVIIVGAGATGIAAATKLHENGFHNLTILEAENRIGGRVKTIPYGDNVIDMGAQWCHGEVGNVVYEMAKDLDLLNPSSLDINEVEYRYLNGEIADKTKIMKLGKLANEIADDSEVYKNYNGNYGDYVIERYNTLFYRVWVSCKI